MFAETSEAIKQLLQKDDPSLGGHRCSQFVAFRRFVSYSFFTGL